MQGSVEYLPFCVSRSGDGSVRVAREAVQEKVRNGNTYIASQSFPLTIQKPFFDPRDSRSKNTII